MGRFKDTNWNCGNGESVDSVEHAQLAVMMDIRDELKQLNRTIGCANFLGLPYQIERTRKGVEGLRRDLKKK